MTADGLLTTTVTTILFFFDDFFIGRFFCVYSADAHYCIDPCVITKSIDGL